MRLDRVDIHNFRSIKEVRIEFQPSCRILVGINESGKSNILQALALLDSNRQSGPNDLRNFHPEEDPTQEAFVRFVFSLEEKERKANYERCILAVLADNAHTPILSLGERKLTLAEFIDSRIEGLYIVDLRTNKRRTAIWKLSEEYAIEGRWMKPSQACPPSYEITLPNEAPVVLKNFSLIHGSILKNIPDQYVEDAKAEDVNSLVRKPIIDIVQEKLPGCLYWTYSDSYLLPPQLALDAFAANPGICEPLRSMFLLADITDIKTAVIEAKKRSTGIRNLLNRVATRTNKHMKSVWKEYENIAIELAPNGSNIDANIRDEHNLYDFSRRSDGFKRFITFLLMVSAKARTSELENTLYLHDEPDVSLHPSSARYLREELIKISHNNYVLYSTHSIFMIDREVLHRHLIVEKHNEVTKVSAVDESNITDEEVIFNALGYSIFENLKKCNIIFEGWRDKRLLQVAMRALPSNQKHLKKRLEEVGMCHARGVKDIGRITPILELADRRWLILSDGDKPAIEQQNQYRGEGPWFRYDEIITDSPAITGEDFIKADVVFRHLSATRSEYPALPEISLEDLSGTTPKLSVIRKWLQQGGLAGDDLKRAQEKLKESIFSNLKPSHIEDKYYKLIEILCENVRLQSEK